MNQKRWNKGIKRERARQCPYIVGLRRLQTCLIKRGSRGVNWPADVRLSAVADGSLCSWSKMERRRRDTLSVHFVHLHQMHAVILASAVTKMGLVFFYGLSKNHSFHGRELSGNGDGDVWMLVNAGHLGWRVQFVWLMGLALPVKPAH